MGNLPCHSDCASSCTLCLTPVSCLTSFVSSQIQAMNTDSSHSSRMTSLLACQTIAPAVSKAVVENDLLPTALALAGDAVPNIRFNVAKVLQSMASRLEPSVVASQVKPCLHRLCDDSDGDVKYYATKALAAC